MRQGRRDILAHFHTPGSSFVSDNAIPYAKELLIQVSHACIACIDQDAPNLLAETPDASPGILHSRCHTGLHRAHFIYCTVHRAPCTCCTRPAQHCDPRHHSRRHYSLPLLAASILRPRHSILI